MWSRPKRLMFWGFLLAVTLGLFAPLSGVWFVLGVLVFLVGVVQWVRLRGATNESRMDV